MEYLFNHLKDLKDIAPWALTFAVGFLCKFIHGFTRAVNSLGETKFKADEAHEYVCLKEPEYERRLKTWKAHRKPF
jgi:hypothetical protein